MTVNFRHSFPSIHLHVTSYLHVSKFESESRDTLSEWKQVSPALSLRTPAIFSVDTITSSWPFWPFFLAFFLTCLASSFFMASQPLPMYSQGLHGSSSAWIETITAMKRIFMLTMLSLQPVVLIASSYRKNLSMWPHCLGHNKKLLKMLNHPHRFWNIQMPWQRLHIWWRCLLYCACHARRFFADPLQASHAARLPSFLLLLRNFPVLLTSGKVQNRMHLPHTTTS